MSEVVLAISGSLRTPSLTDSMLDLCVAGMGPHLEVHKVHPHQMRIGRCSGCGVCGDTDPAGACVLKDDFPHLQSVCVRADFIFLATPPYAFGLPVSVQHTIDRLYFTMKSARSSHRPKAVLISACGLPGMERFDLMRRSFRSVAQRLDWTWAGEILLPASSPGHASGLCDGARELIRRAGGELRAGALSRQTTDAIASSDSVVEGDAARSR